MIAAYGDTSATGHLVSAVTALLSVRNSVFWRGYVLSQHFGLFLLRACRYVPYFCRSGLQISYPVRRFWSADLPDVAVY